MLSLGTSEKFAQMLGGGYELLLILVCYSVTNLLTHQPETDALTLTVPNGPSNVIA